VKTVAPGVHIIARRAPDLQEALLFLARTERGRDAVILRDLLPIASIPDWRKQRVLWQQLTRSMPRA
jgi:hypothetical protein